MRRIIALSLVLAAIAPLAHADGIKAPQFTLSLAFTGLSIADTALTIYGTSRLGLVESNPIMRPFLENRRYAALWAVQAVGCTAILAACHLLIHHHGKAGKIIGYTLLIALNVARGYVVYSNIRLHRSAR